ncbi:MAG: shikimate kinase [Thermodesulfobacteriota bacterium]
MLNIVLAGFMGTGKSTVGRLLSRMLKERFLDLDDLIEKEAGVSISEIFSTLGEARFRALESGVIEKLAAGEFGDGLIISTGGGAVVSPANRKALRGWGTLVCLTASVDEILGRVGRRDDRPLLRTEDVRGEIERLLAQREEAYGDCDLMVDTTSVPAEEVARRIKEFAEGGTDRNG